MYQSSDNSLTKTSKLYFSFIFYIPFLRCD
nr:MAG TPA: hypothetical protein [Caudoviricetes sp.]